MSDVTRGSLTLEQVAEYTDALTRHYGERVAPVSDYCRGFYDWQQAIAEKVKRGLDGEEDVPDLEYWRRVSDSLYVIGMAVGKSSMLNRRIYGGEKLRTEMCPEHKGQWCGLAYGPTPCGCDLTGWLPAQHTSRGRST